jgi:hypothetical protein
MLAAARRWGAGPAGAESLCVSVCKRKHQPWKAGQLMYGCHLHDAARRYDNLKLLYRTKITSTKEQLSAAIHATLDLLRVLIITIIQWLQTDLVMMLYAPITLCIGPLFKLTASERDGSHLISGHSLRLQLLLLQMATLMKRK